MFSGFASFQRFFKNDNCNENQYGEYSQNRETGDEPYKKINRRYLQRIKTAAETFLDADWDGVRISGGKNLNFLNGEVNRAVYDLVIQGAKLGFYGFQLVADFGKTGFQCNNGIDGLSFFQKLP